MKIKIICIYYGKLPSWFPIWLKSCKNNNKYNFLVITDQEYENNIADNVEIMNLKWIDLIEKFCNNIDFPIELNTPYKLCDYRPLYGKVFAEELLGFDFWGHCDLDMIWGQLDDFIPDQIYITYDRIGIYGALSIYRNNQNMNQLYRLDGGSFGWEKVFANNENYIFDEMPGMNCICKKQKVKWFMDIKRADLDTYLQRVGADLLTCDEVFTWEEGKAKHYYVKNDDLFIDEVAYIHFSGKTPQLESDIYNINKIVLHSDRIEVLKESIDTVEQIKKYSDFISVKDDRKQRKQKRKDKLKKFMSLSLKGKYIRFVNQFYIKRFYNMYR